MEKELEEAKAEVAKVEAVAAEEEERKRQEMLKTKLELLLDRNLVGGKGLPTKRSRKAAGKVKSREEVVDEEHGEEREVIDVRTSKTPRFDNGHRSSPVPILSPFGFPIRRNVNCRW